MTDRSADAVKQYFSWLLRSPWGLPFWAIGGGVVGSIIGSAVGAPDLGFVIGAAAPPYLAMLYLVWNLGKLRSKGYEYRT